eukprot:3995906-Amphidinium_carterae.2
MDPQEDGQSAKIHQGASSTEANVPHVSDPAHSREHSGFARNLRGRTRTKRLLVRLRKLGKKA